MWWKWSVSLVLRLFGFVIWWWMMWSMWWVMYLIVNLLLIWREGLWLNGFGVILKFCGGILYYLLVLLKIWLGLVILNCLNWVWFIKFLLVLFCDWKFFVICNCFWLSCRIWMWGLIFFLLSCVWRGIWVYCELDLDSYILVFFLICFIEFIGIIKWIFLDIVYRVLLVFKYFLLR